MLGPLTIGRNENRRDRRWGTRWFAVTTKGDHGVTAQSTRRNTGPSNGQTRDSTVSEPIFNSRLYDACGGGWKLSQSSGGAARRRKYVRARRQQGGRKVEQKAVYEACSTIAAEPTPCVGPLGEGSG